MHVIFYKIIPSFQIRKREAQQLAALALLGSIADLQHISITNSSLSRLSPYIPLAG